jgi:hypothetical protein
VGRTTAGHKGLPSDLGSRQTEERYCRNTTHPPIARHGAALSPAPFRACTASYFDADVGNAVHGWRGHPPCRQKGLPADDDKQARHGGSTPASRSTLPVGDTTAGRLNTQIRTPGLIDRDHIRDADCAPCAIVTKRSPGIFERQTGAPAQDAPVRLSSIARERIAAGHEASPPRMAPVKTEPVTLSIPSPPWGQ